MKPLIVCKFFLLFLIGTYSCSNDVKSDVNKHIISNLNQDIANKTIHASYQATRDLQGIERFSSKVDSSGNLFTKINDVNNIVKKISKLIDSHLDWIKNNEDATVESFYNNDNLNEEYEEIKVLMKQLNNDYFQVVNNNTYLTKYPGNENTIKHLHELLCQNYHSEEGESSIEAFEMDCRLLKLNIYSAIEKLNKIVLISLQGDGMIVNNVEGKVLFDVAQNKDSLQCSILLHAYNTNIHPNIYVGKVDYSKFKDGKEFLKSIEITTPPLIGKNYKKIQMTNSTSQFNISMWTYYI